MVVVVAWIDGGCSGLVISMGWGEEALCRGGELWLLCLGCFDWYLFGLALHWLRLQILQLENAPLRTKGPIKLSPVRQAALFERYDSRL